MRQQRSNAPDSPSRGVGACAHAARASPARLRPNRHRTHLKVHPAPGGGQDGVGGARQRACHVRGKRALVACRSEVEMGALAHRCRPRTACGSDGGRCDVTVRLRPGSLHNAGRRVEEGLQRVRSLWFDRPDESFVRPTCPVGCATSVARSRRTRLLGQASETRCGKRRPHRSGVRGRRRSLAGRRAGSVRAGSPGEHRAPIGGNVDGCNGLPGGTRPRGRTRRLATIGGERRGGRVLW